MSKERTIPNPNSKILDKAMVVAVGVSLPPNYAEPPEGYGVIVLHVPLNEIQKSMPELQKDIGIPWEMQSENGIEPIWFDEFT